MSKASDAATQGLRDLIEIWERKWMDAIADRDRLASRVEELEKERASWLDAHDKWIGDGGISRSTLIFERDSALLECERLRGENERMRGDFLEVLALGLGWMRIANVENSEEVAELESDIEKFNATIDRLHGLHRKGGS